MMRGIHEFWAGKVPSLWKQARLRDCFHLINGFPFPSEGFNQDGRGRALIRIRDLLSGSTDFYFDGDIGLDCNVEDDDIVVGMDGDFNAVWWKSGTALLNQRILSLRPRDRINARFVFYQLPLALKIMNDLTPLSTVKHLSSIDVLALRLWLPSLEAQEEIADFLDRETVRIDQLIEKREAFQSLIDEKKAALAAKSVDGAILGSRANGIAGWFGSLPEGWQAKRAKFVFRERQNRSEAGDEELLTVSHITGVTKRSDKDVNMFLAESTEGYKLVSEGDVVINTMWAWMGAMGVSPVDGLISPSYGVYAPTIDAFEAKYLDLILRSRPFIAEATRRSKGIYSSRLRLYPDAFLDTLLPLPSRETQRAILSAFQAATRSEDALATLSGRSLDRLREFRSALVTAAVTGQIDVATWGKHGATDRRLDDIETEMAAAAPPERKQARA